MPLHFSTVIRDLSDAHVSVVDIADSDTPPILCADMREALPTLPANSVDACCTDPPYGISFMGKGWDYAVPDASYWREIYRVLKPGAHLVAFGGTRTAHRMVSAIEDAGFEIRDSVLWLYGTGFPKSQNIGKAIDKQAGATRTKRLGKSPRHGDGIVGAGTSYEVSPVVPMMYAPATADAATWDGWGTALKPAHEPICLARKPCSERTVAANVLRWGTGALNVDGCRIAHASDADRASATPGGQVTSAKRPGVPDTERDGRVNVARPDTSAGRWPANVVHDGSAEVVEAFPASDHARGNVKPTQSGVGMFHTHADKQPVNAGDSGSVARFFHTAAPDLSRRFHYSAKASRADRAGSKHPTVKPVSLKAWLVRLITPPGGIVLDPFAGTGTTGAAARREGFDCILIEREAVYVADIRRRLARECYHAD